jgi:hypothetical protein
VTGALIDRIDVEVRRVALQISADQGLGKGRKSEHNPA